MSGHDTFDTDIQTSRHASVDTDANGRPRIRPILPSDTDPFTTVNEADPENEVKKEKERPSLIWEITETLVLALLIFVAVRSVVLNFRVDGLSMEPSLDTGQMLLVNRQVYFNFDANDVLNLVPFVEREGEHIVYPLHPPQRGDVVVFDPPIGRTSKPYIKRVIGLPGETITIHDGRVFVDGDPLDEPYIQGTATSWPNGDPNREVVVSKDHLFVMGDNRNNSTDSRSFGVISNDDLIGKAWVSYWPSSLAGIFGAPDYGQ